jgi:hypothetical protein
VLPRDLGNRTAVSLAQNRKHLLFAQALLLRAATRRADGRVIAPANLRGGARVNALSGLLRRE